MQTVSAILNGEICELVLPEPQAEAMPGVIWGAFDVLMTPAYWRAQAWQHDVLGTYADLRFGRTLSEEIAACLLGGYGMPAELGVAAYTRIRDRGLLNQVPTPEALESALLEPFECHGQRRSYRFPKQKARYLSTSLTRLDEIIEPVDDVELRDVLVTLPGIGLKTASWIVRNYRNSSSVAVIDIHILRAGRHIRLFNSEWMPDRHYHQLESAFLQFAEAINTPASLLDGLMWDQMRRMPSRSNETRPAQQVFDWI